MKKALIKKKAVKKLSAGNKRSVVETQRPVKVRKPAGAHVQSRRLVSLLQKHILGEAEMSASQVNAALSLLKLAEAAQKTQETQSASLHEDALLDLDA